ncbi:HutD/Ves family protein [Paracidovorax konjaci]|uniref:HutD protein n=1 Tax=Paracidovorax konjaci TaxID=32040 RepID=A0A1I1T808_9BURK|nr:HutD family protein [Paracidovorax konjaci]SFD54759.1 hypothetical protein SAMN04489710_103195 [Paracidovorax konjaci]
MTRGAIGAGEAAASLGATGSAAGAAVHRFDLARTVPMPWKNGGGHTRELACWPPGAGLDTFEWRVSVASVAAPGPFSAFDGIDRHIMVLEGEGMRLTAPGAGLDRAIAQAWQPFAFAGEWAPDCALLGGAVTDFNLMLRRSRWRGALQVVHAAQHPGTAPAGLAMVLAGRWRLDGESLAPGQGLYWTAHSDMGPLRPDAAPPEGAGPAEAGGGACALAWVALEPVSESKGLHAAGSIEKIAIDLIA